MTGSGGSGRSPGIPPGGAGGQGGSASCQRRRGTHHAPSHGHRSHRRQSPPRHRYEDQNGRPQHERDDLPLSVRQDRFSGRRSSAPPLVQWKPGAGRSRRPLHSHQVGAASTTRKSSLRCPTLSSSSPKTRGTLRPPKVRVSPIPTLVELTTMSGSVVAGPIKESWVFARGQLKSAIYYNTYNSRKTIPNNGAVMRILPLAKEPEVVEIGGRRHRAAWPLLLLPLAFRQRTDAGRTAASIPGRPLYEQFVRCRRQSQHQSAAARYELRSATKIGASAPSLPTGPKF